MTGRAWPRIQAGSSSSRIASSAERDRINASRGLPDQFGRQYLNVVGKVYTFRDVANRFVSLRQRSATLEH